MKERRLLTFVVKPLVSAMMMEKIIVVAPNDGGTDEHSVLRWLLNCSPRAVRCFPHFLGAEQKKSKFDVRC